MKNNYLQKVLANRGVLFYFIGIALLFFSVIFMMDFSLSAYQKAEATKQKIIMMEKATDTYEQKKAILDKLEAKAIPENKIDEVQTRILLQLQRHKLSLVKMTSVPSQKKEKNHIFEMEITGSYEDTMAFLSSFPREIKTLVSLLSVSFQADKATIKTTIKYKVYVVR